MDFGTAKDLLQPDLNGQEFVGTAEYMSPEAIAGKATSIETDLWALGVVAYQLLTGYSTFHSPSPYLAFLRIKKANVRLLHPAIIPVDAAELISLLVVKDRTTRLENAIGNPLPLLESVDVISTKATKPPVGPIVPKDTKPHKSLRGLLPIDYSKVNYDKLRKLAYFSTDDRMAHVDIEYLKTLSDRPAQRIPQLKELCIRAVGKAAVEVASIVAINGGRKPPIPWVQVVRSILSHLLNCVFIEMCINEYVYMSYVIIYYSIIDVFMNMITLNTIIITYLPTFLSIFPMRSRST